MPKKQETALAVVEKLDFVVICAKEDGLKTLIETEAGKAREMVKGLDVNIPADRATMITVSASVRTFKRGIETHAKKCSVYEKAKILIKGINEGVNFSDDYLKNEAKEIRQPVTDWENAEKRRVNDLQGRLEFLKGFQVIAGDVSIDQLKQWGEDVAAVGIDESWQEFREEAQESKTFALEKLGSLLRSLEEQAEKDAELEQFRKEKEDREAQEKVKQERAAAIKKEFEGLHGLCNDVDREGDSKGVVKGLIENLTDLLINEERFGENFNLAEKLRDSALLRANTFIEKLEEKACEADAEEEKQKRKARFETRKKVIASKVRPSDEYGNKNSSSVMQSALDGLKALDVSENLEEYSEELEAAKAGAISHAENLIELRSDWEKAEAEKETQRIEAEKEEAAEQAREAEQNRVAEVNRKAEEERREREADLEHRGSVNKEILVFLVKNTDCDPCCTEAIEEVVELLATGQVPHTTVNY